MAVAIHRGLTKSVEYKYKALDASSWRFYGAWKVLKTLPKFQYSHNKPAEEAQAQSVASVAADNSDIQREFRLKLLALTREATQALAAPPAAPAAVPPPPVAVAEASYSGVYS